MDTAFIVLLMAALLLVFLAVRHLGYKAAFRAGTTLRGTWIGLLIFLAICISAAIFCFNHVLDAFLSGEIHCFGRRCRENYQAGSNPAGYWVSMVIWSFFGGFFVWVIFPALKQFILARRGEP